MNKGLLTEMCALARDQKGIVYVVRGAPFLPEDILEANSDDMLDRLVQSRLAQRQNNRKDNHG